MNPQKQMEEFFLTALLRISLAAILLIIFFDYLFQPNFFWVDGLVDLILLGAILLALLLFRLGKYHASVIMIMSITVISMVTQSILLPHTSLSFPLLLMVGFMNAILLQGSLNRIMHGVTLAGMLGIIVWQTHHWQFYEQPNAGEVITLGASYLALYAILSYTSGYLKRRYDEIHRELFDKNFELVEKANEIETQNEELLQSQQNLYELNLNLERMVHERTDKIQQQNEQLIKYSYTNAHHLRGPVARVLGLIHVSKLQDSLDHAFLFQKIEEQTLEIDAVVRRINDELR